MCVCHIEEKGQKRGCFSMKICNSRLQGSKEKTLKQEETSKQKNNEKRNNAPGAETFVYVPRGRCVLTTQHKHCWKD